MASGVVLPSPNDLKFKILIKNHKDTPSVANESNMKLFFYIKIFDYNYDKWNENPSTLKNIQYLVKNNVLKSQASLPEDNSDHENDSSNVKELSNLVNYLTPVKFQSFEHAESIFNSFKMLNNLFSIDVFFIHIELDRSYELISVSETKGANLIKENAIKFVK